MEVMPRYRADVAWKVGRIMLKFRPIAPKPVTAGSVTSPVDTPKSTGGRKRRRSTSAPAGSQSKRGRKKAVVTLPLMPETPERKEDPKPHAAHVPGAAPVHEPIQPAGSWVTVEEVTDAWHGGGPPGALPPMVRALECDACPGFVSDALGRVTWTNAAYRNMSAGPTDDVEEEVRVELATRGKVPAGVTCFTCRVRVRFACGRSGSAMAAPCDVWRAEGGRLVWRLDVKAALTLGLGS